MLPVDITEACRIYYFQFCLISTGFLVAKFQFETLKTSKIACLKSEEQIYKLSCMFIIIVEVSLLYT